MTARKYDQGNGQRERKKNFSSLSSTLQIKPLSVNKAYTGRKRKSVWLKAYVREVLDILPDGTIPKQVHLELIISFHLSNKNCDIDNQLKPFIDCLQEKYGFNDNQIYHIDVHKKIVKRGDEFIEWTLRRYNGEIDER